MSVYAVVHVRSHFGPNCSKIKYKPRALSADDQGALAQIISSWVTFDKDNKPEKLVLLDFHKQRGEDIVTRAVITRHEALIGNRLVQIALAGR